MLFSQTLKAGILEGGVEVSSASGIFTDGLAVLTVFLIEVTGLLLIVRIQFTFFVEKVSEPIVVGMVSLDRFFDCRRSG